MREGVAGVALAYLAPTAGGAIAAVTLGVLAGRRVGRATTYSTFSCETSRPAGAGVRFLAAVNVIASVIAGLGAVFAGLALAQAVIGRQGLRTITGRRMSPAPRGPKSADAGRPGSRRAGASPMVNSWSSPGKFMVVPGNG